VDWKQIDRAHITKFKENDRVTGVQPNTDM
jgi:hypothetical protein